MCYFRVENLSNLRKLSTQGVLNRRKGRDSIHMHKDIKRIFW